MGLVIVYLPNQKLKTSQRHTYDSLEHGRHDGKPRAFLATIKANCNIVLFLIRRLTYSTASSVRVPGFQSSVDLFCSGKCTVKGQQRDETSNESTWRLRTARAVKRKNKLAQTN